MLHNPSNDIEAWKIGHGYPYPDKLETAYYCIKEKKLFIVGYIEICEECHYSWIYFINLIEMIKKKLSPISIIIFVK